MKLPAACKIYLPFLITTSGLGLRSGGKFVTIFKNIGSKILSPKRLNYFVIVMMFDLLVEVQFYVIFYYLDTDKVVIFCSTCITTLFKTNTLMQRLHLQV